MRVEDLLNVYAVTVDKLSAHADKALMPDHEYTQVVRVIISAGLSVLRSEQASEKEQRWFEAEIYECAKEKWLARCETQIQPDEDKAVEMKRADKAFDYIYKNGRNPKGWPY
jgi:hypothetical protein